MDQKTKDALEASIRHWQENVDAETPGQASVDADDCALCRLFYLEGNCCKGCPVFNSTKAPYCENSPYYDALFRLNAFEDSPSSDEAKQAWRKAAQAMLDFLIFLLPSYEVAEAVHEMD